MDEHRIAFRPATGAVKTAAPAVEPNASVRLASRASFDEIGYLLPRPAAGVQSLLARRDSLTSRARG